MLEQTDVYAHIVLVTTVTFVKQSKILSNEPVSKNLTDIIIVETPLQLLRKAHLEHSTKSVAKKYKVNCTHMGISIGCSSIDILLKHAHTFYGIKHSLLCTHSLNYPTAYSAH